MLPEQHTHQRPKDETTIMTIVTAAVGRITGNNRRFNNRGLNTLQFEGREPTLKGIIYDSKGESNPDQFLKTTREIINYVGRTYTKYMAEFIQAVWDIALADLEPQDDPQQSDNIGFELWKLENKDHQTKVQEYSNFRAGLYNVVLGQCTEGLHDNFKSHNNFCNAYQDGIALVLIIVKTLTFTFEEQRKLADALSDVKEQFYSFKQGENMLLQQYHEQFLSLVEVLDQVGVTFADESLISSIAENNNRNQPNNKDKDVAQEQALAV